MKIEEAVILLQDLALFVMSTTNLFITSKIPCFLNYNVKKVIH